MHSKKDILWVFAEMAAEAEELTLIWHFPAKDRETQESLISYINYIVLEAFEELFMS